MMSKGLIAGLLLATLFSPPGSAQEDVWLLVDTQQLQLSVKKGEQTLKVFKDIAIGRNGAGFKTHVGDDVTPLGKFRIAWINYKSPFYRFFGFDYPNPHNAEEGLAWGLIDRTTRNRILNAHETGTLPPQNTALGGRIGIHGLGKGDEKIHRMMNWTHGCVALTNEQIELLSRYIRKGTWVEIK